MERGRPRREYSREMRGDPVPQNFTNGVRPRWDERRARGGAPAGERAGEIQPAAVARASAQPRSGPLPPRVTFGCWRAGEGASEQRPRRRRAGEGQLRPADAALRAWEDEEDDACV